MKHADAVISELKQLASMVAGSNRICWSLISKMERLRGADEEVVSAAVMSFRLESELISDDFTNKEPTAQELMEIELETAAPEEVKGIELSDDGEDEGPNCFFADEPEWGEYEEEDLDDDVELEWFVYGAIANCLSLIDIPDEDERVHSLDGDDISFSNMECRDEWCQEMKGMIEDQVELNELDQADADLCFNEVLAIENMTSLV